MAALFSYINAMDTAVLSAGSEATGMRSYNLSDPILVRRWRSLLSTSYFLAIFNAASEVSVLFLAGTNIGSTDLVRHRLYDESGIVVLDVTVESGVADGYGLHIYFLSSPLTVKQWRCDITATSLATAGWFDVGRAGAGPVLTPTIGPSIGYSDGPIDPTEQKRGRYSSVRFSGGGTPYRRVDFTLDFMNSTDRDAVKEMCRVVGKRGQLLWVPDTDGDWAREAILGARTSDDTITQPQNSFPAAFSLRFQIEQDH